MLSAIVLGLGLAVQPALHQQVDYDSPNPHTCSLEQNLSPFRAFSTGMAFFQKAEKSKNPDDYKISLTCFDRVIESPDGWEYWRKASFYSALALSQGVKDEDKDFGEALFRFQMVYSDPRDDSLGESSICMILDIYSHYPPEESKEDRLKETREELERLKLLFPDIDISKCSEELMQSLNQWY